MDSVSQTAPVAASSTDGQSPNTTKQQIQKTHDVNDESFEEVNDDVDAPEAPSTGSKDADRIARLRQKKQDKKVAKSTRREVSVTVLHCDIIDDTFWNDHQDILS